MVLKVRAKYCRKTGLVLRGISYFYESMALAEELPYPSATHFFFWGGEGQGNVVVVVGMVVERGRSEQ